MTNSPAICDASLERISRNKLLHTDWNSERYLSHC